MYLWRSDWWCQNADWGGSCLQGVFAVLDIICLACLACSLASSAWASLITLQTASLVSNYVHLSDKDNLSLGILPKWCNSCIQKHHIHILCSSNNVAANLPGLPRLQVKAWATHISMKSYTLFHAVHAQCTRQYHKSLLLLYVSHALTKHTNANNSLCFGEHTTRLKWWTTPTLIADPVFHAVSIANWAARCVL